MITVLIRTSYRPKQFAACIDSIPYQCDIIVAYDDDRALKYVRKNNRVIARIYVDKSPGEFSYNLYCNFLKDSLTSGWGLFVDDDDTVIPGSIEQLELTPGKSYFVPFMRGRFEKPDLARRRQYVLQPAYCGLPNMLLWYGHKNLVSFDATETADYKALQMLADGATPEWLDTALVSSERRGWGRMEA